MRGEQPLAVRARRGGLGSPPLARGTVRRHRLYHSIRGITPACAGNRIVTAMPDGVMRDHPRLRGEQSPLSLNSYHGRGSPPLARGTDARQLLAHKELGITPACAGNRLFLHKSGRLSRDHPRLRGEQALNATLTSLVAGSPPLARGTELIELTNQLNARITPACAGNSRLVSAASATLQDHPRLRGEQASPA